MRQLLTILGVTLRWGLYALAVAVISAYTFLVIFKWQADGRETRAPTEGMPAGGRFIKAADVDVYIQEAGTLDGQDVVLVPGLGVWSGMWQPTIKMLAASGFRVIVIDLPPFGHSQRPPAATYTKRHQAERILGVLNALSITSAILIGHSSSGGPVVEAALTEPKRIIGLVLVDAILDISYGRRPRPYPSFVMDQLLSHPDLRDDVVATFITNPLFTDNLLRRLVNYPASATREMVELYQQPQKIKGTTEAISAWLPELITSTSESRSENPDMYRTMKTPVHVIWGDRDRIEPLEQGQKFVQLVPGAVLKVLFGAGHLPPIEENQRFNDMLVKSLNIFISDRNARQAAAKAQAKAASEPTPALPVDAGGLRQ